LDLVKNLLDDITSRTLAANLPENYADFSADIENLPEDNTLPIGWKRSNVINAYNDYRQRLVDNDFVKEFAQAGGDAEIFANDPANRKSVLDYRKKTTDLLGNVLEITGAESGQVFNND